MKNKYKYEIVKRVTWFYLFVFRVAKETIKVEAETKQKADIHIKFHYPDYEVKASWQVYNY